MPEAALIATAYLPVVFDGIRLSSWVNHPGRGDLGYALADSQSKVDHWKHSLSHAEAQLTTAESELRRLELYRAGLQGAIPVAPDHELDVGFTSEVILQASQEQPPGDARPGAVDLDFFVRLLEKLGSAQVRPDPKEHTATDVVAFIHALVAKAQIMDAAFQAAVRRTIDPAKRPKSPSYWPLAECICDAVEGYSRSFPRLAEAGVTLRRFEVYASQAIDALGEQDPDATLSFKERQVREALRRLNRRLTQLALLGEAGLSGSSDNKNLLASMVKRKLLDNRKDVPVRGYGLLGWAAEGR